MESWLGYPTLHIKRTFQNYITKKRIRDLQELARKEIIHTKSIWHSAIEPRLWPYSLRNTNKLLVKLPDKEYGMSDIKRFYQVETPQRIKNNHIFECPVYALTNRIQSGWCKPNWEARARLIINIGLLPRHAGSVALLLNLQMGIVYPQYHIHFNDFFETARPSTGNPPTFLQ